MFLYALVLTLVFISHGFPDFNRKIPNSERVRDVRSMDPSENVRALGHSNGFGGGRLNDFGEDFVKFGLIWNEKICRADSDGDGRTNGEELGDPDCTWTPDEELTCADEDCTYPLPGLSHPGIPQDEEDEFTERRKRAPKPSSSMAPSPA